jgi:5-formyltetrahydrofolate cyclo-ligase
MQLYPVSSLAASTIAEGAGGTTIVAIVAGYSDIEVALLREAGLISPSTVIVTTAQPMQVVDEPLPETEHDFSVDLIVTTDEVIKCGPAADLAAFTGTS